MLLYFAKLWNWEISAADNLYRPLCFYILTSYKSGKLVKGITNTVPYVSTICQVMKLEISAADNWYCPLCFYILQSSETGKSVRHISDTVPSVSTFCQVLKLGNQCSRWLILSLMFLHFAKLWNWEISAADNWYCPLCFYILPSYKTGNQCSR